MDTQNSQDKPIFILLEAFVLKCIGHLPVAKLVKLQTMEQKLSEIFHKQGSWDRIIMQEMDFPENICDSINGAWIKNTEIATRNGVQLSAEEFAHRFVKTNFDF